MQNRRKAYTIIGTLAGTVFSFMIFIIPFLFMFLESVKDKKESNALKFSLPTEWHFLDNYSEVIQNNNYQILRAFKNSAIITVGAVILLIIVCSLAGFFIQRRSDKLSKAISNYITIGLMVPPSIMPTIWIMQGLHLYKTMTGMILIEACLVIPFTTMLYRSFVATIPVELEEAAMVDGCSGFRTFTRIIFPLLKPFSVTAIILNSVTVFNDFMNPLYFLPGTKNATVQLTLYSYISLYKTEYNLLFANVILVVLPMLILFLCLNEKIVAGMTAGAVKG